MNEEELKATDDEIQNALKATLADFADAENGLSEADKEKALDALFVHLTKDMPGFKVVKGQIKVRDPKLAMHSLGRALCSERIQNSIVRSQIYEMQQLLKQMQDYIAQLGRNHVLIQTLASESIYEILGRGDQWEKSYRAFETIQEVEEKTVGAVRLHITNDNTFVMYGQQIVAETGDVEYIEIPRQFWDGIQFHAIQSYLRREEIRIPKGESLYILFEGSENMLDLIPDDYVPIEERLKPAEQEVEEITQLYEETSVIQHAKVSSEQDRIAKELFPEGVDADGDPIDPNILRVAVDAADRSSEDL